MWGSAGQSNILHLMALSRETLLQGLLLIQKDQLIVLGQYFWHQCSLPLLWPQQIIGFRVEISLRDGRLHIADLAFNESD
jgi:hypothetical protein